MEILIVAVLAMVLGSGLALLVGAINKRKNEIQDRWAAERDES